MEHEKYNKKAVLISRQADMLLDSLNIILVVVVVVFCVLAYNTIGLTQFNLN